VIIVDARNTYTDYQKSAVWRSMPAVKAGRVFAWKPAAPYSYAASVSILRGFGEAYASVA
jgi:iron complex transport system substrate-binding protein